MTALNPIQVIVFIILFLSMLPVKQGQENGEWLDDQCDRNGRIRAAPVRSRKRQQRFICSRLQPGSVSQQRKGGKGRAKTGLLKLDNRVNGMP